MKCRALMLVTLAACTPIPPAPPAPRNSMQVDAPFSRTWEAAIDIFAERNIPIKTLDRSSGLIVAETQGVGTGSADFADCGTDAMGVKGVATAATWNLLVRGDSASSTIRANVRFVRTYSTAGVLGPVHQETSECSTKGVWETDFETQLKARAEAK